MQKLNSRVTDSVNFFQGNDPTQLTEQFGSPLYVYNERIIRERCREIKNLVSYPKFHVNYSAKANSNLAFLQIVRSEGLFADAMSSGEIMVELEAGFTPEEIFFVCNNVSREEMKFAHDRGILTSLDSLAQLDMFGETCPGSDVAIRVNSGFGAGHHEKVITGGKATKFGIDPDDIPGVDEVLKKHSLKLVGINQHIGSLFMDAETYIKGAEMLISIASNFDSLEFIDLGGGLGIPYRKQENQPRLPLAELEERLSEFMNGFSRQYGRQLTFCLEPGRYISAESAVLLGTVHSVKMNYGNKYIGTDLGFTVLLRPTMYDSHHDIEVYRASNRTSSYDEVVSVVGNICESGDYIAKNRRLPEVFVDDVLGVLDAGAYGHVMSSNYNNRLRPAEILIREDNSVVVTRERDNFDDILRKFRKLSNV